MGNEITRWWNSGSVVHQHHAELDEIYRRGELAEAEVAVINAVTKRAMFEALNMNLLRAQAERLAPDGAEHYAMLALRGVDEMGQVIADVRERRWS